MNLLLQLTEGTENRFNNIFGSCITLQAEIPGGHLAGCCTPGCVWGPWGTPRSVQPQQQLLQVPPSLCSSLELPPCVLHPLDEAGVDELVTSSSRCLVQCPLHQNCHFWLPGFAQTHLLSPQNGNFARNLVAVRSH